MLRLILNSICLSLALLGYLSGSAEDSTRGAAIEWLRANAHVIAQVEPDDYLEDLRGLSNAIGDARLVALGEATHGTREFFQLKARVFRYLVEREGFRTFAIEAPFAPSLAVDTYIKTGEGDPAALVHGLGFWTWDTEEVIDLVTWMRAYNSKTDDQLNFYGFDVQDVSSSLKLLSDLFENSDQIDLPAAFDQFQALLGYEQMSEAEQQEAKQRINSPASITRMQRAAMDTYLHITRESERYVAASNARDYGLMKGASLALAWGLTMALQSDEMRFFRSTRVTDVRDRGMADMVHWIRQFEEAGEGIMLWAHNGHLGRTRDRYDVRPMGMLLAHELGEEYYCVGFSFSEGSFQAFPPREEVENPVLTEMRVPAAAPDSIDGALADHGEDLFFVDLRALTKDAVASRWFQKPRRLRWTGARYSDILEARHPPILLLDTFDGLIFVRETTRARPSARTKQRFGLE